MRQGNPNLPPGQGNAGDVNIEVDDAVTIDGIGFFRDPNGLLFPRASQIATGLDIGTIGSAGNINIKADFLSLTNGGTLNSSTSGIGDTGIIDIDVEKAIIIDGDNRENLNGIFNTIEAGGIGNSQNINISADTLSLSNGGQIQTLVRQGNPNLPPGQGNAGDVNIEVDDAVTIDGIGFFRDPNGLLFPIASQIATSLDVGTTGSAGNINLKTDSLFLTNGGRFSSEVSLNSKGKAGDININVEDAVKIDGIGNFNINGQTGGLISEITSILGLNAEGNAGNINLKANSFSLTNGGRFSKRVFFEEERYPYLRYWRYGNH